MGVASVVSTHKKKIFSCLDVVFVNLVGIGGYEGITCNVDIISYFIRVIC